MKVIVAGMPKTGTKTMYAALQELGYTVYDLIENFENLEKEWQKIFNEGGTTEDFRRMFENVDAVTDVPGCYFWDEIHKAFPEAKIILTLRLDEEAWCRSFQKQASKQNSNLVLILSYLSPTMKRLLNYGTMLARGIFGDKLQFSFFKTIEPNMLLHLMTYRRHNSHVLQTAPKDKLLIFDIKEGWAPLCEFLGLTDIPDKPFPHENKNAEITDKFLKTHPLIHQAKREMLISTCCLSVILLFASYKFVRNPSCIQYYANVTLQAVSSLKFW